MNTKIVRYYRESTSARVSYMIQASTLLLFVVPMCAMTVLYIRIALTVRRSGSSPGTPAVTSRVDEIPPMMSTTSPPRILRRATSSSNPGLSSSEHLLWRNQLV